VLTHFIIAAFFFTPKFKGGKNVEENANVANAAPTPAPEANIVANVSANVVAPEPIADNVVETESRAEKRINKLVAEREAAKREAEYWRGVSSQAKPAPAPTEIKPPTVDQFENYDDFLVAKAKHAISLETAVNTQKANQEAFNARFNERINKAAEKDPDILEIVKDNSLPISIPMAFVIKESESAPEILKYLSEHRDESFKIARMNPAAAAREIGKIEYKLSNQPKPEIKKVSLAPEPITPLEAKGPQVVELDKVPMDEFVKRRNQEQGLVKRR
jgi:hypothetical protein